MVPIKDNRFRMILHLGSIALLDNGPSVVGSKVPLKQTINVDDLYTEGKHVSPQVHHMSTNFPCAYQKEDGIQ